MIIYLDIDGTLLHEYGIHTGEPAFGLEKLLAEIQHHETYWLTTHCRRGNPTKARGLIKAAVADGYHHIIDQIKPTKWTTQKIEAIDWNNDFIWLDNDINQFEHIQFHRRSPGQQVIEINLHENPKQLSEVADDLIALRK